MHKVAAQRRVIATVDAESADDLARDDLDRLPLHEYLGLKAVWPLRTFEPSVEDCRAGFAPPAPPKADTSWC